MRTMIAGVFGMYDGGVPLASHPHRFGVVIGMVAVLTGLAGVLAVCRRKQW